MLSKKTDKEIFNYGVADRSLITGWGLFIGTSTDLWGSFTNFLMLIPPPAPAGGKVGTETVIFPEQLSPHKTSFIIHLNSTEIKNKQAASP